MQIFMLIVGLAILFFWNYNRMQGIELAAPVYAQDYSSYSGTPII